MKTSPQTKTRFLPLIAVILFFTVALPGSQAEAPNGKKTNLDFDGSVVEMVNRNPQNLTSLMMVGMDNSGRTGTLFHKKENFRPEIQQNLKDMGEAP